MAVVEQVADALIGAERPVLLIGRGSRSQVAWDRRVRLAELLSASVIMSSRERAAFLTGQNYRLMWKHCVLSFAATST